MRKLYTAAGEALTAGAPGGPYWDAYPRPQLAREEWLNLNGDWELDWCGTRQTIRVPFCPESLLSGVTSVPKIGTEMVYRRSFTVLESWRGRRVLLHFGAVMREAIVLVNKEELCRHDKGYLPFTVDVTGALREGDNELTVAVTNDLDPRHPYGKQKLRRGGMWYTPCSGI